METQNNVSKSESQLRFDENGFIIIPKLIQDDLNGKTGKSKSNGEPNKEFEALAPAEQKRFWELMRGLKALTDWQVYKFIILPRFLEKKAYYEKLQRELEEELRGNAQC